MGTGLARADWLLAEDAALSVTDLSDIRIRNFATPNVNGYPDHYSIRSDALDITSTRAFPTTRFIWRLWAGQTASPGYRCEGVGFSNRKQIEKVFYRAFTQILTASATFSSARAACIQAARDPSASARPPNAPSHRPGTRWESSRRQG